MPSAGEVWKSEAQIVSADQSGGMSSVEASVSVGAYLKRVGATPSSVMKTPKDVATVEHFQRQIARGSNLKVELHLDEFGNVIYADGRHRAVAALKSGMERITVNVRRRHGG